MSVIDLPPGTRIGDRYKLLKAIGQGGFGITYIAWDESERCQVAVKECFPQGICVRDATSGMVVPARDSFEPRYMKAIEYMRREVTTLAGLDHDSIVRVRDVIWGNGSVFCVMPWLPGGTLRDVIDKKRASISPLQATDWLHSLLNALRYMHERSIIHRDIKPANIMFDEQQRPVIIDFGAALNRAERTSSTTTSQGAFSHNYAAPEQITGKGHVGPWTDFYSLAATWYELITGVPPEAADARLLQDDVKMLSKQASKLDYPVEMLALLDCNMSLHAKLRCQSVEQWEQCWAEGSLPTILHPAQRRRRVILTSAVFCIVALGGFYAIYSSKREESLRVIPLSQMPTRDARAELTRYIQHEIHFQEFFQLCEEYRRELALLQEKHARATDQFVARYAKLIDGVQEAKAAGEVSRALYREHRRLSNVFDKETSALRASYMKDKKRFFLSTEDIQEQVRPRNREEELMFPTVCGEISMKLSAYEAGFIVIFSEMPDKEKLNEEYLKLEKSLSDKSVSLL